MFPVLRVNVFSFVVGLCSSDVVTGLNPAFDTTKPLARSHFPYWLLFLTEQNVI
jgi:hypothetical protein